MNQGRVNACGIGQFTYRCGRVAFFSEQALSHVQQGFLQFAAGQVCRPASRPVCLRGCLHVAILIKRLIKYKQKYLYQFVGTGHDGHASIIAA